MAEFTFHHGGVSVPSLDAAIAWYGRVLGCVREAKQVDIAFVVRKAFAKGCLIRDCAGNLIDFVEEPTP